VLPVGMVTRTADPPELRWFLPTKPERHFITAYNALNHDGAAYLTDCIAHALAALRRLHGTGKAAALPWDGNAGAFIQMGLPLGRDAETLGRVPFLSSESALAGVTGSRQFVQALSAVVRGLSRTRTPVAREWGRAFESLPTAMVADDSLVIPDDGYFALFAETLAQAGWKVVVIDGSTFDLWFELTRAQARALAPSPQIAGSGGGVVLKPSSGGGGGWPDPPVDPARLAGRRKGPPCLKCGGPTVADTARCRDPDCSTNQ
jgi:hypothetical protein